MRLAVDEAPLTMPAPSGTDLAGPDGIDGVPTAFVGGDHYTRIREIVLYDRELSDLDLASVRDYLRARHRP